ncbi:hypothetical protein GGR58DRAFT_487877 [Xylaria digitata]|nr:hypothetical protein GGR58DRAFT_487877 [Xylaria digitata]
MANSTSHFIAERQSVLPYRKERTLQLFTPVFSHHSSTVTLRSHRDKPTRTVSAWTMTLVSTWPQPLRRQFAALPPDQKSLMLGQLFTMLPEYQEAFRQLYDATVHADAYVANSFQPISVDLDGTTRDWLAEADAALPNVTDKWIPASTKRVVTVLIPTLVVWLHTSGPNGGPEWRALGLQQLPSLTCITSHTNPLVLVQGYQGTKNTPKVYPCFYEGGSYRFFVRWIVKF